MKLDRDAHRKMLKDAADAYPHRMNWNDDAFPGLTEDDVAGNMLYLEQLGLMESGLSMNMNGMFSSMGARITAQGLDFLQDDGGYTAILGTVTIKLHEDTLKELIATRIQEAPLTPADKKKWTDALRSLPADATKQLSLKLIESALKHAPDAMHWLETYLRTQ